MPFGLPRRAGELCEHYMWRSVRTPTWGEEKAPMVQVTRLDGTIFWINPHQIEYVERNPDTTLVMLSGKRLIVKEGLEELTEAIVRYRQKIGALKNEL